MGDWVVQDGGGYTWMGLSLLGNTTVATSLNVGEVDYRALTLWTTPIEGASRYRYPEKKSMMKTLQVRGHIMGNLHRRINPQGGQASWADFFNRTWRVIVSYRITVLPQDNSDGEVLPAGDYNLADANDANDEFVWERQRIHFNVAQSDWTGTAGARTNLDWTIPVVARTNRTVRPGEGLALVTQLEQTRQVPDAFAGDIYGDAEPVVQLHSTVRLRTYVQAFG